MSSKRAREKRREQRLEEETAADGQDRRKRLIQLGVSATFLAVLAVVVLIVVSQSQDGGGDVDLEGEALVESQLRGVPQKGITIGHPDAKVTLVEFGDLQCPVCKSFSEDVIPQIISGPVRDGEAKVEFRNFTIINEESVPAGAAAIAAGEQGRGWHFIELFYRNQGEEASGYVTDSFLTSIAEGAGVQNIDKWNKDRKSKRILNEVNATTEEAGLLGLTGTPSFTIKGPGSDGQESLGTLGSAEEIEIAIQEAQ